MNSRGWVFSAWLACLGLSAVVAMGNALAAEGQTAAVPGGEKTSALELQRDFLGETLILRLDAVPVQGRDAFSNQLIAEIDRLAALLNRFQGKPAVAHIRAGEADIRKLELRQLMQACEAWREQLSPHFSCRQGGVWQLWQQAEASAELPDRTALRRLARSLDAEPSPLDAPATAPGWLWAPQGLLQGWVLDTLQQHLQQQLPDAGGLFLQLGANLVFQGNSTDEVSAVPVNALDASIGGQGRLVLHKGAMALGGGKQGEWLIGNRRFSQAINPADGWPAIQTLQVLVIAPDAVTARAVATALPHMPVSEGLALVNRLADTEVLIMTETGKLFPSAGWYSLLLPDERHQPLWNASRQFLIEYEIPAHPITEYRRPYAAIWITDDRQQVIRQLLVHGKSLRWLREVPLWWRRHGRRDEAMADGLSRATPQPGRHMLVWDGRNDTGEAVAPGRYVLHIEAAREHGGRELLSVPFELSGFDFELQKQGEKELGWVKISLHPTVD